MDVLHSEGNNPSTPISSAGSHHKRKRSPSSEAQTLPAPPPRVAKAQTNHLQINYLVRYYSDDLQLVTTNDSLPTILALVNDYDGVLQRHESMAGNLGAKPLGPILIKRFDRIFDGAPKVLKNNGKEGTTVSWLDVVEFARNKPEQFKLEATRDGVRVCQFYTKQCRVEITEEDYVLVASGMPQKLIPPQPIVEDEEKELGTLEILEVNLGKIIQLADQVSARARQLNHRLKNRKNAIISRRAVEAAGNEKSTIRSVSPPSSTQQAPPVLNGIVQTGRTYEGSNEAVHSPQSGFVAVNSRPDTGNGFSDDPRSQSSGQIEGGQSESLDKTYSPSNNGRANKTGSIAAPLREASPATRRELLTKFFTTANRPARPSSLSQAPPTSQFCPPPLLTPHAATSSSTSDPTADYAAMLLRTAAGATNSTVAIPQTPSSLITHASPSPAYMAEKDDGGPYKAEMVSRMEKLERGDRVLPPCDRCRRLHMDCVKNLTACAGCTKKHAKCAWKDVKGGELAASNRSATIEEYEYRNSGNSLDRAVSEDIQRERSRRSSDGSSSARGGGGGGVGEDPMREESSSNNTGWMKAESMAVERGGGGGGGGETQAPTTTSTTITQADEDDG